MSVEYLKTRLIVLARFACDQNIGVPSALTPALSRASIVSFIVLEIGE